MTNRRYARSAELFERARKVIPLASQTFSKSHVAYPQGQAPLFLSHGKGSHVWDVDGNEYVDFVSGLLPVILGYDDPDVSRDVTEQLGRGITFSLATEAEIHLAETLVEIIPCAEKVRFGKNGSDATAAVVRVARAFTGRSRVACCGYHGWQDWYIGATARHKGVPGAVRELTHTFPYNDLAALDALLTAHQGEFACVIMEPMTADDPASGYLQGVKDLAHQHGALLAFDEIITGFRFSLGGAQELFGVTPDLAAFGKGMANGFPLSAVVGRSDVMAEMEDIFFSFTAGGEAISLVAALSTIDKLRRERVIDHLWRQGDRVLDGLPRIIEARNLQGAIGVSGKPCWSLLRFRDAGGYTSWQIKTLFMQEMLARGILIQGSHNLNFAHTGADMDRLMSVYAEVLETVADAVHNRAMNQHLRCPPMEPLFRIR